MRTRLIRYRLAIEAPTKLAAEEAAMRLGFGDPWAHPVSAEQAEQAQWLHKRRPRHRQQLAHEASSGNPNLIMRTATTAQLRTAIEVLKFEERIDNHATHFTMQLPEARLAEDYSARIESQTIEQIARVKTVAVDEFTRRRPHENTENPP